MPKLSEVCRYIRSKNAGPFWITVDLFFADEEGFQNYSVHPAIGAVTIAQLFGVDASTVKVFSVPDLRVVKLSYPRLEAQGGVTERDMHGGQQYVRLLDLEL